MCTDIVWYMFSWFHVETFCYPHYMYPTSVSCPVYSTGWSFDHMMIPCWIWACIVRPHLNGCCKCTCTAVGRYLCILIYIGWNWRKACLHWMRFKAHWARCALTAGQCVLNAHQPASTLAVVMRIELKRECVSPAFVIGSGTLTRALVSSFVQPTAISNAKYRKKVRQQFRPRIEQSASALVPPS